MLVKFDKVCKIKWRMIKVGIKIGKIVYFSEYFMFVLKYAGIIKMVKI